jgi:hypothetical protein
MSHRPAVPFVVFFGFGFGFAFAFVFGVPFLVAGCGHAPPRAPSAHRCDPIDRENQVALDALPKPAPAGAVDEFRRELRDALACTETARGAWALTVGSLTADDSGVGGRWSLTYVNAAGARLAVSPDTTLALGGGGPEPLARRQNLEWSANARVVPLRLLLFDYDGDGEPEAVVIVKRIEINESGTSFRILRGRVWSARAGAIELYAPARELIAEEVRDVDQDGRPDLVTRGPYAALATVKCGSEEPYPVRGPTLVAHSLAGGGFSWSDAQAVAFARQECPSRPRPVLVSDREHPDFIQLGASARNLACARLWGADEQLMLSDIQARCHQSDNCPTCDDKEMLERWAAIVPPFRFASSP